MPLTGIGNSEPDDLGRSGEIPIRVTAPEEFIASAVAELNLRRGYVTGMENVQPGTMVIRVVLPLSEYALFEKQSHPAH